MKNDLEISVVRTESHYKSYLAKVDQLMEEDPLPNSVEGKLMETLVILVEAYEKKKGWELPMAKSPIHIIKTRMDDLGLKQSDLIKAMGDKSVVSKVLSGTRKLTYSMVAPLSELLRVPPELLLEKN